MAENKKNMNTTKNKKGSPSEPGQDKASVKKGKSAENLKREEEIRDKFLDGDGKIPSDLKTGSNRNVDKINTSPPKYGNS